MDKQLQQEDTVSADRKERIIFDPDAWRKKDKSGRKTSAITSRQNFDNEKFTRNTNKGDEEEVKESVQKKKSDNSQIEFVTGTETAGSASTATGNAQKVGVKKISEAIVKKAITKVKADKNVGTEEIPFDPPYSKVSGDVVDKSGAHHTPMSRVRHLARQALNKQVKEEVIDEKAPEGFEGTVKAMKKNKDIDNPWALAHWMKNKGYKSHRSADGSVKEEVQLDEGKMGQIHADIDDHLGKHLENFKKVGGAEHFGAQTVKTAQHISKLHGIEQKHAQGLVNQYVDGKLKEETTMSKTYAQFVEQLLEYTPGPGGVTRVQGRSYGAQYHDPEGDDDADDKPAAKVEAPKRGRGRPKGATSGANHKVTSGKKTSGVDYTGYKLHLPNTNR